MGCSQPGLDSSSEVATMALRFSIMRRFAFARSQARRGPFGSPRDHEPLWIENWNANTRQGKDSLDWFFRAFNATGIYELALKSSPRFYTFMVMGGIVGGYYWSRMWDHI